MWKIEAVSTLALGGVEVFQCGLPHILIRIWQLMALSDHEFSLSGLENKRFYCIRMYFKLFGESHRPVMTAHVKTDLFLLSRSSICCGSTRVGTDGSDFTSCFVHQVL